MMNETLIGQYGEYSIVRVDSLYRSSMYHVRKKNMFGSLMVSYSVDDCKESIIW